MVDKMFDNVQQINPATYVTKIWGLYQRIYGLQLICGCFIRI